ncbi:hypothetical protein PHYBLDRAFT_125636 [Phycomyces blakesleeanus NRRL 1555(-)]|uniref:Uncharacterized protein n=1 Tax=Phycomyces blakesleeanus (strain ATCC 8743b / DSM 1359 / FGSC 10004 / NBRC 33097 / NRRL 1555) TaxID=763407 RepID=A0A162U390_PHYB8|nr:hypothetical protein PHYBLDRAFT_125636 [Phycomyces blakesleeanus NRRL 1555(-)]OAD72023.1 hypothetical protein PHYBLDRAFT_125636 [Phycomyces blakesleeanus NRRL 1555(-)]|eukprot:XP_018290063.1 hypothetical protein PHYBLDRAFT_125636 [Phycomyces blakesleeanus NRRL 1555(-)]
MSCHMRFCDSYLTTPNAPFLFRVCITKLCWMVSFSLLGCLPACIFSRRKATLLLFGIGDPSHLLTQTLRSSFVFLTLV